MPAKPPRREYGKINKRIILNFADVDLNNFEMFETKNSEILTVKRIKRRSLSAEFYHHSVKVKGIKVRVQVDS